MAHHNDHHQPHEQGCSCGHHHEHEHHHEHGEHCSCGHHHDHEHHHHHHADDVFTSWGCETVRTYTQDEIRSALDALSKEDVYGTILRAKGIVKGDGEWIHFDYVPGEADVRTGSASAIGRICVIGAGINEDAIKQLF